MRVATPKEYFEWINDHWIEAYHLQNHEDRTVRGIAKNILNELENCGNYIP